MIQVPKIERINISAQADRVILAINGRAIDIPFEQAHLLALALRTKANEAEEYAKAEAIALDQAILLRSGAPIGLTSNKHIQAEAAREAAWNSKLRKYMPGGIKSREQFGKAAVIKHPKRR